jgi:hypothetical protein
MIHAVDSQLLEEYIDAAENDAIFSVVANFVTTHACIVKEEYLVKDWHVHFRSVT